MRSQWLNKGRMLWYSFGNLTKDQSKQIVEQAIQLTGLQSIPKDELPSVRHIDLSHHTGNFHRLDFTVQEESNENSCLMSYYQYGLDKETDGGRYDLLNQVVLQYLSEPTFDTLRTKEQLGYVVFARPRSSRDVLSCWFLIQSPGKNCEHIRNRLDIHLAKMRTKVQNMTDEEFKTV